MTDVVKEGYNSMGEGTFDIPLELYRTNRKRLVRRLRLIDHKNDIVLLQGGNEVPYYDTDVEYNNFRQESYFMWTFGVWDSGCMGAIDVNTGTSLLFVPKRDPTYSIWMGRLLTLKDYQTKYGVDQVHYLQDIRRALKAFNHKELLVLTGTNSDSNLPAVEATFEGINAFTVNCTVLLNEIAELRVIKTDLELEVLRYVNRVSSAAHRMVMKSIKPGWYEYQAEADFLHFCYKFGGCRYFSYACICGSGPNSGILHYGHGGAPNNRRTQNGDMCLFDMGVNYFGYSSDTTCSYPVNGTFSKDQRLIYEAVLDANKTVFAFCKPGVQWLDMHILANRTILTHLVKGGLIAGSVDKMLKYGLGSVFMPHGLGHLIGLDVHDVGSYLPDQPERPIEPPGADKLRMNRILQPNMCLTIEPGCYFIDHIIDNAKSDHKLSRFLKLENLERFRGFGGVRIEDNIIITKTGCENMTSVPRTVEEIEKFMTNCACPQPEAHNNL